MSTHGHALSLHKHHDTPADLRRKEIYELTDVAMQRGEELIEKADDMTVRVKPEKETMADMVKRALKGQSIEGQESLDIDWDEESVASISDVDEALNEMMS